jgi:hypothetical protein
MPAEHMVIPLAPKFEVMPMCTPAVVGIPVTRAPVTCNALSGCTDIARYAEMIKRGDNIRQWDQEVLADAIIQYT